MSEPLTFPPLLSGVAVTGAEDPFDTACAMAALGCDGGTVVYNVQADRLRGAIVFAPEVVLEQAMAMLPLCGVGFQNALGNLAPPEVAVHLDWSGGIRVNGAGCGRLRAAASDRDPDAVPDWLVIGLEVPILFAGESGVNPEVTALYDEGCGEVDPGQLLESWARHVMTWLHRWDQDGNAPVHGDWIGLVTGVGEPVEGGVFLGVDDRFGMLIREAQKEAQTTRLVPLSSVLEGS